MSDVRQVKHKNMLMCHTVLFKHPLTHIFSFTAQETSLHWSILCLSVVGWEADKKTWCFSFPMQHLARWVQQHELDLSAEKTYAVALCQSLLSGAVQILLIVGFLYELAAGCLSSSSGI